MNEAAGQVGRPRSEEARQAVLHAVDDLLLEVGYAAMTMKGIAERAGVGRQTVYRWWSTKAEILLEASADDAAQELAVTWDGGSVDALQRYLHALTTFLTVSPTGIAYRALLAAAQHDSAVARLVAERDPVMESAQVLLSDLAATRPLVVAADEAAARLVGPTVFWVLTGRDVARLDVGHLAEAALRELTAPA
jgi:AcrR family transcriptional regulator